MIGAYLAYTSSFPAPEVGESAPLWPYFSILLACTIIGIIATALIYVDGSKLDTDMMCLGVIFTTDFILAIVHLFVSIGYWFNYASDNEHLYPYPAIPVCFLTLCAGVDAILIFALMPVTTDDNTVATSQKGSYTPCNLDEELGLAEAERSHARSSCDF
ncbi:hypothetical protein LTR56_011084 [Elasticomyces elasticus]|nr:hypothetical protein LTR56_011084 [Elasticomyces elasticus]KAK3662493.1 hypothetical protein LTR22_006774 [Elasticomyces elasticus]KAK4926482.1 hypothetical protein LTR49_006691 [Elasticomyces elasticus]KAK5761144.1 hypothetical protein LTS12_008623 [Elasticomyces elasticus]